MKISAVVEEMTGVLLATVLEPGPGNVCLCIVPSRSGHPELQGLQCGHCGGRIKGPL